MHHALADGLGDCSAENECSDKVPEGSPGDGAERREHARGDNRGDGIGGVMPAIREFEGQGEKDDDEKKSEAVHRSGALEDDAFDDVRNVFALVNSSLDDFEDFFPLDDLDGVFFLVEELGDQSTAQAVAIVFVAVDFDTVLEGFLRLGERTHGQLDLRRRRNQDLDEVDGSDADGVHAVEDKTAGGCVDQVNHVVQAAAELVNVFTVKGGDEGLVQLGEESVGDFVAFVLDGFDDLHLFRDAGVVREQFEQGFSPYMDIRGLLGKKVKETLFARQKPLQKSWHGA